MVEIVSRYTQTFLWLQQYDEGLLEEPSGQTGKLPTAVEAMNDWAAKAAVNGAGEATELFARLQEDGLLPFWVISTRACLMTAYPSVESKAAHLLYFVVKNHPFSDGNKRSGAFLFVDFCRNGRLLNARRAGNKRHRFGSFDLLVAESDPKQKEVIIPCNDNAGEQAIARQYIQDANGCEMRQIPERADRSQIGRGRLEQG